MLGIEKYETGWRSEREKQRVGDRRARYIRSEAHRPASGIGHCSDELKTG